MRAAPSTSSSVAGPVAVADAKVAGNSAGAAASESSSTAAAGDRNADSSQEGSSGAPFAAALASAQADTDRKSGAHAAAVPGSIEGQGAGPKMLQRLPAARPQTAPASGARTVEAGPKAASLLLSAVAPADSAADTLLTVAADSSADPAAAMASPAPKVDGDTGAPATPSASASKSRSGKHSQTADALGDAVLSTLATLLGAATTQISAAAPPSSGTASSTPRSAGNGAEADSAVRALSGAVKPPSSRDVPVELTATSSTSIDPPTTARATSGSETNSVSASAGSLVPAHGPEASASGASNAGLATAMQSLSAVTNSASASAPASIGVPVSHSSWPSALAAQVQWMATRQVQSATLRLSPEHLGPLEVRIDVTNSQINVNFTAHHPDTREALAQTVPQLRQLFAAGGLNLGEATVRQESGSSEQPLMPQPSSATARSETVEPVANTAIQRLGLVDEYA